MVKLFCFVVGAAGSPFPVDIAANQYVGDLKQVIKTMKSKFNQVDAEDLVFFLAKKDKGAGAWLTEEDVATLRDDRVSKDYKLMKSTLHLENDEVFGEDFQPEEGQVHVLVVAPENAGPSENNRKRKRIEDEIATDSWIKALEDDQVTTLPLTCEELREHLQRPLHVKVPINRRLLMIVATMNTTRLLDSILEKVFEPESCDIISDITAGIVGSVIDPVGSGTEFATENTYIHLWDSLIAGLLRRVSTGRFRRNTNASASTGPYRPDLCFYYKDSNICVFRGEEKASGDMQVPITELHEKLTWRYDGAPYVFGYAAVGVRICLVAIRQVGETKRTKVEEIQTYDLGALRGRLSFFLAMLNLSTLFDPVVNLIEPLDVPEYGIIERSNGVQITFAEDCVVKTYPSSMPSGDIIRNLKELHRQMQQHSVPNVVKLKRPNLKKKCVELTPIGRLSPPENVHQLLVALRDILKALVALHAINLMHRDLRWDNVLKYTGDGDKWFLIDFDEGTRSPAAKVTHLKAESHAPEILSSFHTVKVDIWGVGFLLRTSRVQDLPPELESLKAKCLKKNPSSRPTAISLLKDIESLLESCATSIHG
ncbi:hypothetical protein P3T76_007054 [Phytophthora citrophthora]|uniref:Protein kinase domain-containing protein n=1 Tax=Phytophthora citrophthora TaxID=4793 RepID=A0AAD9GN06_9STRA|nr:hypothetical protein P3T76_007054 [Phytophthora citrophthora]